MCLRRILNIDESIEGSSNSANNDLIAILNSDNDSSVARVGL